MSDLEYQAAAEELRLIDELVETGVLGPENMPESSFLRWNVLQPDKLPDWLRSNFLTYNEIRWYRN